LCRATAVDSATNVAPSTATCPTFQEIATIVKLDTILAWHRKLVARKFDGSKQRRSPGRPRVDKDLEDWVVKMAMFFIKLNTREVHIAGLTSNPNAAWMMQIARNLTMDAWGVLKPGQYLIHDRDSKYCDAFKQILDDSGVKRLLLPPRYPWLNSYAERWVKSVEDEALSQVIQFGERSLHHVLSEYLTHYHEERCHQGLGNVIPLPSSQPANDREGAIACRERLGGLLKYYHRQAA
jgi:putative transposase